MPDRILEAASVSDFPGLAYCIGSFGRRVNFAAQQNRALNLAWALHAEGKIERGTKVAVIGAGVTGLTIAAGLIAHGCQVDIYDRGITEIPRQTATLHRWVHPTINSWPERKPHITTRLPFLEWFVGPCNEVADALRDEFAEIRQPEDRILPGTQARTLIDLATDLIAVNSERYKSLAYGLVIIAVGFGDEETVEEFETVSYWFPDKIEIERNQDDYDDWIVSGCGDGGCIDALRVIHLDFEQGYLTFEVAARLYETSIAHLILEVEQRLANAPDAVAMEAAYAEAARLVCEDPQYADVDAKLEASMEKFGRVVHLTDVYWARPFSPNAAPIHKLLIAHARRKGRVRFEHGAVKRVGNHIELAGRAFKRRTKVIIRHGAKPERVLEELLSNQAITRLRAAQAKNDRLAEPQWSTPFPTLPGQVPHDPASEAFRTAREPMARDAIHRLDRKAKLAQGGPGYKVVYARSIPPMAPTRLFGVETAQDVAPVVEVGS